MKAKRECVIHLTITPKEAWIIRQALNHFTKEEYREESLRMIYILDEALSSH